MLRFVGDFVVELNEVSVVVDFVVGGMVRLFVECAAGGRVGEAGGLAGGFVVFQVAGFVVRFATGCATGFG